MAKYVIKAPTAGAVYRRPMPDQPPFVDVGDTVAAEQTVCLIEIMKRFMEVKTEAAGTVAEIRFEDEQFVQQDEILVVVDKG